MSLPAVPLSRRQDARPVSAIVLIAVAVILVQFAMRLYALDRVQGYAAEEADTRVEIAAGAVTEGFHRQVESWTRVQDVMAWFVRTDPNDQAELGYVARRLRQIAESPHYAVSTVMLCTPQGDWHLATGPHAPLPADLTAVPQTGFLVGNPVFAPEPDDWLIPLSFALPRRDGAAGTYGIITLDGRRLSAILRGYEGRPGQRVGLWRGDGTFLAGTETPAEMVAKGLISPLRPGPDGRRVAQLAAPVGGEPRIVALRALPGLDLFLTVSVARDVELALFEAMEHIAIILEITLAGALLAGTIVLVSVVRARGRARLALAQAETDRRLAIEVQAAQNEVLEGVDAGVYLMNVGPGDRFERQDFNSGTARLLRRSVAELAAVRGVMAFAEPAATEAERLAVLNTLRTTGVALHEARLRCGDGQLRWFRFQLRVVHREGEVMRCIGLLTDIETEKAATAAAVLAARLATLGELSAGIAHEMKQPLAAIALISETMQLRLAGAAPPDAAELLPRLARVSALVERASSVTEHLRAIARNQDGGATAFSLREAADGALLLCGFALRDGGVEMELALPEALPRVIGHQVLVEQVLLNLLMNARDAMAETPAGTRHLRVAAVAEEGSVRLTVRDTGPGIPAHVMPRLFEPFFTTKPVGVGTGLGLSICASILKACGGGIGAANPPGGGAEFTITLLAMPAPAAQLAEATD